MAKRKWAATAAKKNGQLARKKRRIKRRPLRIPRGGVLGNLPRMYRLRYCDFYSLSSVAGAQAYYTFRANGLYDPNKSGTGHQPFLHDTLATLWTKYVVLGSKIQMTVLGYETKTDITSISYPGVVGIILDDNDTISSNYTTVVEQQLGSHRVTNSRADKGPVTLSSKFSAKKFFGLKDVKDNQYEVGANFGSDPTRQAYFVTWYQSMKQDTDTAVNVKVVIDYIVWVSEPQSVAGS